MLLKLIRHSAYSDCIAGSLYYAGDLSTSFEYLCETYEPNPDASSAGDEYCHPLLDEDVYPMVMYGDEMYIQGPEEPTGVESSIALKQLPDVKFEESCIAMASGRKNGKKAVELYPVNETRHRRFMNEVRYGYNRTMMYLAIINHKTLT